MFVFRPKKLTTRKWTAEFQVYFNRPTVTSDVRLSNYRNWSNKFWQSFLHTEARSPSFFYDFHEQFCFPTKHSNVMYLNEISEIITVWSIEAAKITIKPMIQTTEKQSQITNPMFSLIFTCQSMPRNHKPPALFSSTLGIHIHGQGHGVWKSQKKSHSTLRA